MSEKDGRAGFKAGKALYGLASLNLTVGILLWIALMCIIATFVPQQAFMPGVPAKDLLVSLFSFHYLFHSLWLVLPVLMLGLNISACMILRIRSKKASPRMPSRCSHELVLNTEAGVGKIGEHLVSELCRGFHVKQYTTDGGMLILGDKSRLRRYAPFLIHVSILLILTGAWLGMLGFKATMEIGEGEDTDVVRYDNGEAGHLPFKVRCDAFQVRYYDNGMPREYRSELAFMRDGKVMEKHPVLVNHPVSFDGILFSQSGYDARRQAVIAVKSGGRIRRAIAGEGTFFPLDENRIHVLRLVDDVMRMGPAVQMLMETPQGEKPLWIFRDLDRMKERFPDLYGKMPELNPSIIKPYTFTLENMENRYTTVIGLNRDPGIIPVACGAVLFLAGILIVFLVPPSRIWVGIDASGRDCRIRIARMVGGKVCDLDGKVLEKLQALGRSRA